MYASVKRWINVPITIKPFAGRSATGDKLYGTPHSELCYPQSEAKLVRDAQGAEVVSNTRLYVEGSVVVTELDNIVFEGKDRPIRAIESFYRNGIVDVKVVYL